MDAPEIQINHKVQNLHVYAGESLTLNLASHGRHEKPDIEYLREVLEVRVTQNGTIQIFCNRDIPVVSFDDWYDPERRNNDTPI